MGRVQERLIEAEAVGLFGDETAHQWAGSFVVSHFSECAGLSVAASGLETGPAFSLRSRAVLWQPGSNVCRLAAGAARDPARVSWFDYSRYWHGYRVAVFPLVAALGYRGAQAVLGAAAILALAAYCLVLLPRVGWPGALAGFAILLGLTGTGVSYLTPTHAVSLAVLFGGSALFVAATAGRAPQTVLLAAVALGCAYNFADFLYNPGMLAMAAAGGLVLAGPQTLGGRWRLALGVAAATLAGYGGFWAAKWLVVAPVAVLGEATAPVLPGDFQRWMTGGGGAVRPGEALAGLAAYAFGGRPSQLVLVLVLALVVLAFLRAPRPMLVVLIDLGGPILLGLATLEAASRHSLAHVPFTFRPLAFALALLAMAAGQVLWRASVERQSQAAPQRQLPARSAR